MTLSSLVLVIGSSPAPLGLYVGALALDSLVSLVVSQKTSISL